VSRVSVVRVVRSFCGTLLLCGTSLPRPRCVVAEGEAACPPHTRAHPVPSSFRADPCTRPLILPCSSPPPLSQCTDFILFEPATELVTLVVFLALEVIGKDVVEVIFDSARVPEPLTVNAVRGYVVPRLCAVVFPTPCVRSLGWL
jgi:hypothetical protein